jgi:hypothetical protein
MNKTATVDRPPNHAYFDPNANNSVVLDREQGIRNRGRGGNGVVIHNYIGGDQKEGVEGHQNVRKILLRKGKLTLDVFCDRFELSDDIRRKARNLKILNSHSFCLVSDAALEREFEPGEVADIEFARESFCSD